MVLISLLTGLSGASRGAESNESAVNRVVVQGARAAVTTGEFKADLLRIPEEHRGAFALDSRRVAASLNNLLLTKTLAVEARELGLDRKPENATAIQLTVERALAVLRMDAIDQSARKEFEANIAGHTRRARELYLINPKAFADPELVHAAHVLIQDKDRQSAEAKALADRVRQLALEGKDFAQLAAEYSEDPGSKSKAGDLGFFARESMVKPFADAAFSLKTEGEISPVVKTQFGYHVIKFLGRQTPKMKPFEEVKDTILAELQKKFIQDARDEHIRAIREDATVKVDSEAFDAIKIKLDPETYRKATQDLLREEAKNR